MIRHHTLFVAALSVMMLSGLTCGSSAQSNPYEALRRYDFQERASLAAIQKEIVAAHGAPQKLAAIETRLVGVLTDPSATFGGKQEACKFLSHMGTARCVPVLARLLTGDQKTAEAARYALERIPGPEASRALRLALAAVRGPVKIGVLNSIGVRRDPEAVPQLARSAADKDPAVSAAAMAALGNIGTEAALDALKRVSPAAAVRTARAHAMIRCAERLVQSGQKAKARTVYAGLAAAGNPAPVRVTALRGLITTDVAGAAPIALAWLRDPNPYIQRGAAQVLAATTDPRVTRQAAAAFAGAPAPAQIVLITGWCRRKEAAAADTVLRAVLSPNAEVRTAAIQGAGRLGGARAAATLAEIAGRGDGDARLAREALAAMPGDAAAGTILKLAREGKPPIRAALMEVLAARPGARSTAALLAGARDPVPDVAAAALRGLASVGAAPEVPQAVAVLVSAGDDNVREAASRAVVACVQRSGDRDQAVTPVLAALTGASRPARIALLGALAEVGGDRALAELKAAAASDDAEIKRAAVRGLAETWADSAPAPMLLDMAKQDASTAIRVLALRGYIRMVAQDGAMPAEARIAALLEAVRVAQRPDEKKQAIGALRDCRDERAVAALVTYLDDTALSTDAAEAILDLAAPQKRSNRDLPAVKGPAVGEALDAIIQKVEDSDIKERARKLK